MLADYFGKLPSSWYNELGSTMTITSADYSTGSFSGTYNSTVGTAKDEYVLSGRFDTRGDTLGWVVSWQNAFLNAHSTTAWSGHLDMSGTPQPVISSTWLLTSSTTPENDWQSTNVGFDTFTQNPPSKEQILMAQKRRQCSHPKLAFKNK